MGSGQGNHGSSRPSGRAVASSTVASPSGLVVVTDCIAPRQRVSMAARAAASPSAATSSRGEPHSDTPCSAISRVASRVISRSPLTPT